MLLLAVVPQAGEAQLGDYECRYHTYPETVELLERWTEATSELSRLYSIGKSQSGSMDLWMVGMTNRATGPAEEKPAAYFDGNQHDNEVMGGETALHLVWWILSR